MKKMVPLLIILLALQRNAAAQYRLVTTIRPPSGMSVSYGRCSMNNHGQAVYVATDSGSWFHSMVVDADGTQRDVGFLADRNRTEPLKISDTGQVVGQAYGVDVVPYARSKAFSWTRESGISQLPTPDTAWSTAYSVNSAGTIVGCVSGTSYQATPCWWDAGRYLHQLPLLGGTYGYAADINELGQIAGSLGTASNTDRACVWEPGGSVRILEPVPGYEHSEANWINNSGQVLGWCYGDERLVTLWNPDGSVTTFPELGTSWAWISDLNERGQFAGNHGGAYVYSPGSGVSQISVPGLTCYTGFAISNDGTVAAMISNGYVILEPVPEPSSAFTLICALGCLHALRSRGQPRR